jgi:ribosomal protein S18 acetylase RimI-like enzyme
MHEKFIPYCVFFNFRAEASYNVMSMNTVTEAVADAGMVVEQASLRDLRPLRHLEQICFPKDAWPLLDLIGVLTYPGVVRLKAVVSQQMVGFIAGDIRRVEGVAWIATVAVLPEYQHKGIGAALLQACEERITVRRIRLCVRLSNEEAIRLYERAGYLKVGQWSRYYQDGESALVMEKTRIL